MVVSLNYRLVSNKGKEEGRMCCGRLDSKVSRSHRLQRARDTESLMKRNKRISLKDTAIIWPLLSYMCRDRSTAVDGKPHQAYFEPSLNAFSLRSDVMSSITIHSHQVEKAAWAEREGQGLMRLVVSKGRFIPRSCLNRAASGRWTREGGARRLDLPLLLITSSSIAH